MKVCSPHSLLEDPPLFKLSSFQAFNHSIIQSPSNRIASNSVNRSVLPMPDQRGDPIIACHARLHPRPYSAIRQINPAGTAERATSNTGQRVIGTPRNAN